MTVPKTMGDLVERNAGNPAPAEPAQPHMAELNLERVQSHGARDEKRNNTQIHEEKHSRSIANAA